MLIHTVFFWLRDDLTDDERATFEASVKTLTTISSIEAGYVGTPAATEDRPVIDSSYDYCLTVLCKDLAAHDIYQVDPIHLSFIETCAAFWTKVLVYDAD